jgi:Bacterial transcriptional activator domain/NB-ARC domain
LWRGEPLGGLTGQWAERARRSWRQEHQDAVIAWAQAQVQAGDAAAAVAPLTELAAEHPLVEPVAAALIRALHAAGRSGAALEAYTAVRRLLAEELGTDPGPELQGLQRATLRGHADTSTPAGLTPPATAVLPAPASQAGPARPVPAQLPAEVLAFTGRQAELAKLDAFLADGTRSGESAAVVIAAVSGTAGVGKTALAVRWAHRVAGRFPDGQLYVNLRGYDADRPVRPRRGAGRIALRARRAGTGHSGDVDGRAARYRTETASRRILVVLDNAGSVEQVRPLLPGSPTCVVVVTSRDSLAGLVAVDGASRIDLDLLPTPDALALLRSLIGHRVDAEPEAAAALAGQCARLPLALRVAAELAVARSGITLASLVGELADRRRRLDRLDPGGDPRAAVQAVFSWSVQHLPPDATRTFGLLGLDPAPEFDGYAAAALPTSASITTSG